MGTGFEIDVKVNVPKTVKIKISNEMEHFCNLYATDPKYMGNALDSYKKAYKEILEESPVEIAELRKNVRELLDRKEIQQRIQQLLDEHGFNDANIDRHHLFLINQFSDLPTKMKGIEHYNKLKQRTRETPQVLILPTPIMDVNSPEHTEVRSVPPKISNGIPENNSN